MSSFLSLADFEGRKLNPHLTPFEILLEVVEVAARKLASARNTDKPTAIDEDGALSKKENMEEGHNYNIENTDEPKLADEEEEEDGDDSELSSKAQRLMKEKQLKQPMKKRSKPVTVMAKQRNGEPKLMSAAIKAQPKFNNNDDVDTQSDESASEEDLNIVEKKRHKRQKLENSQANQLSGKINNLQKTYQQMTNKEWIMNIMNKRNRQNFLRKNNRGPTNPLPSLPKEFEREIVKRSSATRPNKLTRLIHKTLYQTDVSVGHGRVSIPCSQIESFEFLKDSEMTHIRRPNNDITVPLIHKPTKNGVPVNQPPLIETPIKFTEWDLHKGHEDPEKVNPQYLLRTTWNKIVQADELRSGDVIQIWAFRNAKDELCMALVVVERGAGHQTRE